ncbi:MAG: MFS transporter [Actinomycetota bacterium]|nr:MFS transporter [Actinomycetota bacterium]
MLRENPAFRQLWFARSVSYIGDILATVALVLHIEATEGSGVAVGILLLAQTVPTLLGPFAGTLADRVDQRKLMVTCDIGQACVFGLIAVTVPSFPVLIGLVAVAAVLATMFRPAGTSVVPSLVREHELLSANAWLGTSLNVGVALGPLLGGVLFALGGVEVALAFDAVTFLLSATFLLGLPALRASEEGTIHETGFFATTREGLSFARHHAVTRAVVLTLFLGVAFASVDNVALVFLARDELGAGSVGYGIAVSAFGIGMTLISMALVRWSPPIATTTLFVAAFLATGLGNLLTGLAPVLALVVVAQVFAGGGNGVENIADNTLLQKTVPKPMLGRAFGLSSSAAWLGSGIAYAAGGVLVELTSPRFAFVLSGAGVLGVALLAYAMLRKGSEEPAVAA